MFSSLGPRRFRRTFHWAICMTRRPSQTNPWGRHHKFYNSSGVSVMPGNSPFLLGQRSKVISGIARCVGRGEKTQSSPTPLFLCPLRKRRQVHRETVQEHIISDGAAIQSSFQRPYLPIRSFLEDISQRAYLKRIYSFLDTCLHPW
jgi:hypothetical protein